MNQVVSVTVNLPKSLAKSLATAAKSQQVPLPRNTYMNLLLARHVGEQISPAAILGEEDDE